MTAFLPYLLASVVGLAGGIAVGSGFVAFLTVLDIIPRLAQVAKIKQTQSFEAAVVCGALSFTLIDFLMIQLNMSLFAVAIFGLFCGIFVGMLAAALTEVLNVFPIMAKRLRLNRYLIWLLMAMVLGKVAGSLFDWLIFKIMK